MTIHQKIRTLLPKRKSETYKGSFGRVFILAGSKGLSGACILAGNACLRAGAGLVTVGVPESLVLPLARRLTEVMTKSLPETKEGTTDFRAFQKIKVFLKTQDVLVIGPGLSQNSSTQKCIQKIIHSSRLPMVIDADGFPKKGFARFLKLKAPAVLTPHLGEFLRVFGGKAPKGLAERKKRALQIAQKFKVVMVLKGHQTVVASPKGEVYVNTTGNPGMATAGLGDILSGMIAAFLGQGLEPFHAAWVSVYLHGLAGDLAAKKVGEISLVASDLLEMLPVVFKKVLGR